MYPGNKRKKLWREEKERLLKMTLEERRKEYLRDYVPLKDIATWKEEMKNKAQSDEDNTNEAVLMQKSLSEKVSLYRGDITVLEIDAIVNAGTSYLKLKKSINYSTVKGEDQQCCNMLNSGIFIRIFGLSSLPKYETVTL
uniref:O-acetyl-ADP-ribose deacetylase MACROD2 n=1 Tax=Naja naja TaxID=35670 RepID=A0A8C6XT39_NAJNA